MPVPQAPAATAPSAPPAATTSPAITAAPATSVLPIATGFGIPSAAAGRAVTKHNDSTTATSEKARRHQRRGISLRRMTTSNVIITIIAAAITGAVAMNRYLLRQIRRHNETVQAYVRGLAASATYETPAIDHPRAHLLSEYENAIYDDVRTHIAMLAGNASQAERIEATLTKHGRVAEIRARILENLS